MDQNLLNGITSGKFHTLHVKDANGVYQDILVLIGAGGSGSLTAALPLAIQNGQISIDLSQYSDTSAINNLLANYTDTTGLNSMLSQYQPLLTAGANIQISNNTISATSPAQLILQVDGVTQNNVTTLNFLQNQSLLSGGVLNVSRLTHYDKIPLIYSTSSIIKDLKQDASGNLQWGTDTLAPRDL